MPECPISRNTNIFIYPFIYKCLEYYSNAMLCFMMSEVIFIGQGKMEYSVPVTKVSRLH